MIIEKQLSPVLFPLGCPPFPWWKSHLPFSWLGTVQLHTPHTHGHTHIHTHTHWLFAGSAWRATTLINLPTAIQPSTPGSSSPEHCLLLPSPPRPAINFRTSTFLPTDLPPWYANLSSVRTASCSLGPYRPSCFSLPCDLGPHLPPHRLANFPSTRNSIDRAQASPPTYSPSRRHAWCSSYSCSSVLPDPIWTRRIW